MTEKFDYDLFVIGAGSGGVRAARVAAGMGVRVGIAEERYLGGTCVNVGCIPKKLFSYAAHYSHDFDDSAGFGWKVPQAPVFSWQELKSNKDQEIRRLNGIYQSLLENAGATLYHGRATLRDRHVVCVDGRELRAEKIILALGGWPYIPVFAGSEHVITSNEFFALPQLPESIVIVGGGYIGVELAGICAGLGVETTLVNRSNAPLRGFDEDVRKFFANEFKKYATLRTDTHITEIQKQDGRYRISFDTGEQMYSDAVLYATGRKPNTTAVGLEQVGVKLTGTGAIAVDESFLTSVDNIYAVGDVIDRVALTPVALAEGQALVQRLFSNSNRLPSYENIPSAVFSQPNIAMAGLTEHEARERYADITVFKSEFRHLRHTLSGRKERTFLKMLVDKVTDRVVGIHMVGADAGEIIQGMAVAMNAGATKAVFDATIGIHPTAAEEFVTLRTPED